MIKIIYLPLLAISLVFCTCETFAQTSPTDMTNKSEKESSFKFGVNYLNNNVFMGRADTVTTPAILPEIKYAFKNGIFISAGVDYITNRLTNKLDAGSLALGCDYDITDNMSGGVSFTKLFYNPNSTQIGSSINGTVSANLNYDIAGIITPSVSVDYDIVKQGFGNDIFVNAGLTHDFAKEGIFGDKDLLILSPTVAVNAGSQNFYDAYLTLKKYKLKAQAAAAKKLIAKQKVNLSKFNLLDYEFSAPFEYKTGHFIISFIPTYAYAENKLPARITKGMVDPGVFYFETGAALKF
jgi:hypothetical protein